MNDNNLFLDFKISKSKINAFIHEELKKLLVEKIEVSGYMIQLKQVENNNITVNVKSRSIIVNAPVNFGFTKSAGLFSIEGEGTIKICLEVACQVDEDFLLTTKSTLVSHDWIESPKVTLGQLTIPVETLSDCVIKYVKEDTLEKLDKKIASDINLNEILIKYLNEYGINYPIYKKPDLYFNFQLLQIQSDVFREDENDIHVHMWLEILSKVSDLPVQFEQNQAPKFFWTEEKTESKLQKIDIELSYKGIAKMIISELNGQELGGKSFEIESIHMRMTSSLEIKANLLQPIKGLITITCLPTLDIQQQHIDLENLDIDIDAQNIIYKLSSPIIERIIRTKIQSVLPIKPAETLSKYIAKIPNVHVHHNLITLYPHVSKATIETLNFGQQSINCTLLLGDAEVDIVV